MQRVRNEEKKSWKKILFSDGAVKREVFGRSKKLHIHFTVSVSPM
jgi:hypothetical protein